MARIVFDKRYAPCGFLIVRQGAHYKSDDPADTNLIQSDWDFPGVASTLGFVPCECGATDGTVACEHKTPSEMISAAWDFLRDLASQPDGAGDQSPNYPELDEYLERT